LAGEVRGGVASALVSLAPILTLGLLAFGALGAAHADVGVRAGFSAAIFGGLVATVAGGAPIPGAGVRTSSTLILAALVTSLAFNPSLSASGGDRVAAIVFIAGATLALAGIIQIAFALARLGTLVRFVPYPVIAGFMNGVAILIVVAQLPYMIGLATPLRGRELLAALPSAQPWTLLVGVGTAVFIWIAGPRLPRLPVGLLALCLGTGLYAILAVLVPADQLGPQLGELHLALATPDALAPLASRAGRDLLAAHWAPVLGTAFALAVIGSLDSLLAAAAVDVAHNTRHRPNRELFGVGLANVVSGAFGGIPISFSAHVARAAYRAGARTRASGLVLPAVLLVVLLTGAPALAMVPFAVLAGIMVTIGVGLIDRWTRGLVGQLLRGTTDRDARGSLALVAIVCLVTVVFDFVVAVVFGVIAAMALFIASMNRSLVRASWSGLQRTSRRVFPARQARRLRELGERIRVLELEGAVFFGTVFRLAKEVEGLTAVAGFVILDFRRVNMIDASGAVMLEQLSKRLADNGVELFLAHVTPENRHGRTLTQLGTFLARPRTDWFEDVDRALEAAEVGLLAGDTDSTRGEEIPLESSSLFARFTREDCDRVRPHLLRRELAAGEVLFREGEPGDRLYVLTRGSVTIFAGTGRERPRIGTFEPGVIFGEMAMLDGAARSATAVADRAAVAVSLSAAAVTQLLAEDPDLGGRLLLNIGRHLANRLRLTTDALRAELDAPF
jgi:MFS superfamily sulfate permease-like transporter